MPVVKNHSAASMLREAIVLDLGDLSRQGERIVAAAQDKARRLITEAQRQVQQQANAAHDQAVEQGHIEGMAKGLEEGRAQGRAEALKQAAEGLRQIQETWTDLANQWQAQRDLIEREAREGVLDFALRFAERLVHRVIDVDKTVIVDQVAAALDHVLKPMDVTVLICPDDRPALEEALPNLLAEFAHLTNVKLQNDQTVIRGGCEIHFGQGAIDATLDNQIRRLLELILPDDAANSADAPEANHGE
ncbi:MAG: hypothetical protein IT443_01405 [Phycisphaeraceae bacterium]|nr:hypothetical protein [Phycisphaeraceae bacterium]